MRRAPTNLAMMVAVALALTLYFVVVTSSLTQDGSPFPSGRIELSILNQACAAVSPQFSTSRNPEQNTLNDGNLDEAELAAIEEGCMFQAVAIAPNGMRLTDIPLVLVRSEAGRDQQEVVEGDPFQGARSTDDYGAATWQFRLTPHTDFLYTVLSPNPTGQTVGSNTIEIQLCTGPESLNAVSADSLNDAGRGCP